jgi:hypothetical protein
MAAWMTNDGANYRIAFLAVSGLGDAEKLRHNGMRHRAFEYKGFADLTATLDGLTIAAS